MFLGHYTSGWAALPAQRAGRTQPRAEAVRPMPWQGRYGAFSAGQSGVDELRQYIRNQREHHKRVSFQDEFRAFLRRYEIECDER